MGTKTTVVVSLGCDYNLNMRDIGPNTEFRCRKALWEAWRLTESDKVTLAMAPGSMAALKTGPTMAVMMEKYFLDRHADLPLMVNRKDRTVWGTLAEMRWVFDAFPSSDVEFVFVAARRQDIRVRFIARWFFAERRVRVITSDGPASSLSHEALGYAKLLAVKVGFEPPGRMA